MSRSQWLFPALFLTLLLGGYGLVPLPRTEPSTSSYDATRGGKKVFFDLAARLLPEVKRSGGSLVPEDPETDVLLLLGPARYPDRAQWQRLHDWVSQGRALVFAAKWQDPAVELAPFGVEIVPELEGGEEKQPAESSLERPAIETDLVEGEIDWRTSGQIRFGSGEAAVLLSWNGTPQVVSQPVGEGILVVVASDFVFSNLSMTDPVNGVLAFRILERAAPSGPVYLDEGMNRAGAPAVVGILLEEPFRLPSIQLLLVALLFGWASSRRFGPIATRVVAVRRSLVEHAEALGSLHYRAGTGASLLSAYLEYFGRDLGLTHRADARARRLEIAPGRKPADAEVLARALRAQKSRSLERNRLASILSSLARLRTRKEERT